MDSGGGGVGGRLAGSWSVVGVERLPAQAAPAAVGVVDAVAAMVVETVVPGKATARAVTAQVVGKGAAAARAVINVPGRAKQMPTRRARARARGRTRARTKRKAKARRRARVHRRRPRRPRQ